MLELDDITEFESDLLSGHIKVRIIDMDNGLLVMITDSDKFKLGVTSLAIPSRPGMDTPVSSGIFSPGSDDTMVRTIAERISAWTKRPCLLVVHAKSKDREFMVGILTLLKNQLLQ